MAFQFWKQPQEMDSLLVDLHWDWIFTVGGFSLVDSLRVGAVAVINDLPSLVLVLVLGGNRSQITE